MPKVHIKDVTTVELPRNTPLTELENIIPFGCRAGACGSCAIEILAGGENLSASQTEELEFVASLSLGDGIYRLACQCRLLGDISIQCC